MTRVMGMSSEGLVWPIEMDAAEFLAGLLAHHVVASSVADLGAEELLKQLQEGISDWKDLFEDIA